MLNSVSLLNSISLFFKKTSKLGGGGINLSHGALF